MFVYIKIQLYKPSFLFLYYLKYQFAGHIEMLSLLLDYYHYCCVVYGHFVLVMMHWVQMHKIRTSRFLLDRPEPGDDRRRGEGVLQHDGGWGDLRLPGRARQQDAQYTLEEESAGKLLVLTLRKP